MEQLSFLGLPLVLFLILIAPDEQLVGSIEQLPLPLSHRVRLNGVVGGDLLHRLAAIDRHNGDPDLEHETVVAAFANR